ncbi:OprO/OprP family phosphate-selective porin [Bacteriovoracaceae bacterium]|nr:OprO/OprP family phosphate-selective porin [Bacteriovoracaceae bacterium]
MILYLIFGITLNLLMSEGNAQNPITNLDNWQTDGEIYHHTRMFEKDKTDEDDLATLTAIGLEAGGKFTYEDLSLEYRLFALLDKEDPDRKIIGMEEAYLKYTFFDSWDAKIGYQYLNWSSLEEFHPTDSVNSTFVDYQDEISKMGELTGSISYNGDDFSFTYYYFPRFKAPILPGPKSRQGLGVPIKKGQFVKGPQNLSRTEYTAQHGARLTFLLGNSDFSFHVLDHIDRRHPHFILDAAGGVIPTYHRVLEYGGSIQYALEGLLLKLEGVHLDFDTTPMASTFSTPFGNMLVNKKQQIDHTKGAIGAEYTLDWLWGMEGTIFTEYQRVFDVKNRLSRAELDIYQNDLFIGHRLSFNDIMSRELTVGYIADLERSGEYIILASYKQRLSDYWNIEFGGIYIDAEKFEKTIANVDQLVGLTTVEKSDSIYLKIGRFF